jgi:hypothetical protein
VTTRRLPSLPDIADDDFRRRLDPLARAVVPGSTTAQAREPAAQTKARDPVSLSLASSAIQEGGGGEGRTVSPSCPPDNGIADDRVHRRESDSLSMGPSAQRPRSSLADRIAAATQMEVVLAARGPKKGVEFLLPERIISALKIAAAQEGTSMTVKVLEALRDAGYPITDADFVDLRKLPKR